MGVSVIVHKFLVFLVRYPSKAFRNGIRVNRFDIEAVRARYHPKLGRLNVEIVNRKPVIYISQSEKWEISKKIPDRQDGENLPQVIMPEAESPEDTGFRRRRWP